MTSVTGPAFKEVSSSSRFTFPCFKHQAGVVKTRLRPGRRVVAGLSLAAAALCASFAEAQTGAEVESVTVTNGGSGYTSAPTVTFPAAPGAARRARRP